MQYKLTIYTILLNNEVFQLIKDNHSKKIAERFTSLLDKIHDLDSKQMNTLPEINEAFKSFLGISSNFANVISKVDLIKLLRTNMLLDANKLTIAAKLIFEEGKYFEKSGDTQAAFYRYERAFTLIFVVFFQNLDCDIRNYKEFADEIVETLTEYEIEDRDAFKVAQYFGFTGNYANAENCIFQLLNNTNDKETYKAEAIKFYEDLLNKTDDELKNGDLSRDEAKSSLEEIKNNFYSA